MQLLKPAVYCASNFANVPCLSYVALFCCITSIKFIRMVWLFLYSRSHSSLSVKYPTAKCSCVCVSVILFSRLYIVMYSKNDTALNEHWSLPKTSDSTFRNEETHHPVQQCALLMALYCTGDKLNQVVNFRHIKKNKQFIVGFSLSVGCFKNNTNNQLTMNTSYFCHSRSVSAVLGRRTLITLFTEVLQHPKPFCCSTFFFFLYDNASFSVWEVSFSQPKDTWMWDRFLQTSFVFLLLEIL